jgi:hypothetical protein
MAWYDAVTLAEVDHEILPFWEGLKRHEFLLFRCKREDVPNAVEIEVAVLHPISARSW